MATSKTTFVRLSRYATPAAQGTLFLLAVDAVTNVVDYGFHAYLGRSLSPGDFATVQTLNAVILIVITTFGVLQPVVARFVAESETVSRHSGKDDRSQSNAIFQHYFRSGAVLGLILMAIALLGRQQLAQWLNVPTLALSVALLILPLALTRPVVAGLLQGRERMVAFGLTRTVHAVGRLVSAVMFVSLAGMLGAVVAFPIGAALALITGLILAGGAIWQPGPPMSRHYLHSGLQLAAGAFLAYAAYMSLLNNDLIWVNRMFSPDIAGSYATAVLLRRVLALVPGALVVVMYPRAIARITQGQLPDGLLLKTAAAIAVPTLALTALYFVYGTFIAQLAFGSNYHIPGNLLGWMGLGMLGYGFGSIWLSLFLATKPLPFVILLLATAIGQQVLFSQFHASLVQIVTIFVLGGWVLATAGLVIYLVALRPSLSQDNTFHTHLK